MGKWRNLFEATLLPPGEREFGEYYVFNPPATHEQLASVEEGLGFPLPDEVREMLQEFNGVRQGTSFSEPGSHYFSTAEMLGFVRDYVEQWEDETLDELARHVVFICHENGLADLYGVVVRDCAGFRTGEVIRVDHEDVAFPMKWFESLAELVRDGPK